MAWLTGWDNRKSVTLSRASGAVSNYQMKLLVGESSGATGEEVDCGGLCLTTFNDLRFTKADGTTLLDYWIESITGTTPNQLATVWIEFDSIGTTATTFYMYYGKADASAVSNGANTFIVFDDFERGSDGDTIGGSWTEVDNHVHISTEQAFKGTRSAKLVGTSGVYPAAKISVSQSDNIAIQQRIYKETAADPFRIYYGDATKCLYISINYLENIQYTGADGVVGLDGHDITPDAWNLLELNNFNWTAHTFDIWLNGTKIATSATMKTSSEYEISFSNGTFCNKGTYSTGQDSWFDNFIVRNWVSVEPVWGTWGEVDIRFEGQPQESATITDTFTPMHLVGVEAELASISDVMKGSDLYAGSAQSATIGDVFADNYDVEKIQAESASIDDTFIFEVALFETINDGLGLADTQIGTTNIYKSIAESLDVADEVIRLHPKTITDLLFIYDTLRHGWGLTAEESLGLTEDISNVLGLLISDWLGVIDTQSNNWNGRDVINDTLNLFDVVEKYFSIADTLEESLVLTDANNFVLTVAVLEYLGFSSLVSGMKTMAQLAEDTFAINDTATNAFIMLIEEVLQSVDVISVIANLFKTVQELLTLDEGLTLGLTIGKSVSESLTLTDVVANQGSLFTLVSDTLKMDVTVEFAGEVYECYVLNTAKFMPSMYSGFNFNSYCVFENRAFGANDTGIFELTGSTDAGATIHTGAILNETDFGSRHQKRFRRGYLGISGTSPVMVMETEDGSRQVYTVDEDGKVVFQHDQKSKKWKLSVADFDTLETMQLVPIILTR